MQKYVFVLCPPYSGSTVLWRLLQTSPNVSAMPTEGQFIDAVKPIMRRDPWNPEERFPWDRIKQVWSSHWDPDKTLLLEKSPPNLIRADEIERTFSPAYFIAMIRDPYAQCEGLNRRRGDPPMEGTRGWERARAIEHAAKLWVGFAERQIENIRQRENVIHFTYEDLTERSAEIADRLLAFLPELERLDPAGRFHSHSVLGHGARQLTNLNDLKVRQLSYDDIMLINSVIGERPDLLEFFGYSLRQPSKLHDFHYYNGVAKTVTKKMTGRVKKLIGERARSGS